MTDDDFPAEIAAKLTNTLHRGTFYCPRAISVQGLVNRAPVATDEMGEAKQVCHDMATADDTPVQYQVPGESVCLSKDWEDQVGDFIRALDPDQVPWDLQK
jgi:hypothetical protein